MFIELGLVWTVKNVCKTLANLVANYGDWKCSWPSEPSRSASFVFFTWFIKEESPFNLDCTTAAAATTDA